jgi:hypothetical protein
LRPGAHEQASRPVQAGDNAPCNRITTSAEDDRYDRGRCFRRQRCLGAGGYDHRHAAANEIGRKRRQPIILISRIRYSTATFWPST